MEGRNGAGKTTLMRAVAGLFNPAEGEIWWQKQSIGELMEEYFKQMLYVGHRAGIKEELTATENLQFAAAMNCQPVTKESVWQALWQIGLRGYEDQLARAMSAGQKRRVALARLLLNRAPLWLLDEPFTALDKRAVAQLMATIHAHLQQGGMVMMTTHQEVNWSDVEIQRLQLQGLTHG